MMVTNPDNANTEVPDGITELYKDARNSIHLLSALNSGDTGSINESLSGMQPVLSSQVGSEKAETWIQGLVLTQYDIQHTRHKYESSVILNQHNTVSLTFNNLLGMGFLATQDIESAFLGAMTIAKKLEIDIPPGIRLKKSGEDTYVEVVPQQNAAWSERIGDKSRAELLIDYINEITKNEPRVRLYRGVIISDVDKDYDYNQYQLSPGLRYGNGYTLEQLLLTPRSIMGEPLEGYDQAKAIKDATTTTLEERASAHKFNPSVSNSPFISASYSKDFATSWVGSRDKRSWLICVDVPESLVIDMAIFQESANEHILDQLINLTGSDNQGRKARGLRDSRMVQRSHVSLIDTESEIMVLAGIHPDWIIKDLSHEVI